MNERARSASAWVAAALVGVAVAGVVYLRPSLTPPPAPIRVPAGRTDDLLGGASFADPNRGVVTVARYPGGTAGGPEHYATADGGRTWSRSDEIVYAPPMAIEWRGGTGGTARVSADGGRTWRRLAVPEVDGSATLPTFIDARHGWWTARAGPGNQPLPNKIWRTEDGGSSWRRVAALGLPDSAALLGIRWLDTERGVASTAGAQPSLFLTGDGGETWRLALKAVSPLPGTRPVIVWPLRVGSRLLAWLTVLPQDQLGGAAGGISVSGPRLDVYTYLLRSTDDGLTWGPPIAGPSLPVVAPPVADAAGRLLLLDGRRLWVSADDGGKWTARVIQAPSGETPDAVIETAGGTLFATAVSDEAPAAAVRPADRLLRSTDGGVHWDQVPLPRAG